jgi:hypothetical protein
MPVVQQTNADVITSPEAAPPYGPERVCITRGSGCEVRRHWIDRGRRRSQRQGTELNSVKRTIGDSVPQSQVIEEDTSGHGAVLCAWRVYINLRAGLNLCFPSEYPELREDLDSAIGSMNRFIAANRKPPTTMAEVEALVAGGGQRSLPAGVGADKLREARRTGEFGEILARMAKMPRASVSKRWWICCRCLASRS